MIAPTFYEYVANCFYPWLIKNSIQFPVLLLVDEHKSHVNLELSKFCYRKKIILYCFLANATNVLQPADVGVFCSFKANWRSTVREWKESNANKTLSKTNFTPVFKKAFDAAVDSKKIQNAF